MKIRRIGDESAVRWGGGVTESIIARRRPLNKYGGTRALGVHYSDLQISRTDWPWLYVVTRNRRYTICTRVLVAVSVARLLSIHRGAG